MRDFLLTKLGPARDEVVPMLAAGAFVDPDGAPLSGDEPYTPHTFIWFHRRLRDGRADCTSQAGAAAPLR